LQTAKQSPNIDVFVWYFDEDKDDIKTYYIKQWI
jgi:hypothetical protein